MSESSAKAAILKALSEDLGNTLRSLATQSPYRSVVWRLFKPRDGIVQEYSLDDLLDLLTAVREGTVMVGVMRCPQEDIEQAKKNPKIADIVQGASAINLTDFIRSCCYDKTILDNWMDEIVKVIMSPMHLPDSETNMVMSRVLYQINNIIDIPRTRLH